MSDLFDNGDNKGFGSGSGSFGGFEGTNRNASLNNFGSNQPSGQGGGFQTQPTNQKPKKKIPKGVFIGLGVVATLGLGGFGIFKFQQHQQQVKQEQVTQDQAFAGLQSAMETALFEFSTDKVSDTSGTDGISLWDLNLTYVSYQNDRANFVNRVSRNTSVKLTKGSYSVVIKSPNWDFVAWVIKNVDNAKVTELTKELKQDAYTYSDDLVNAFSKYINNNLTDMLTYRGDYVSSYMVATDVPQPYIETEVQNGIVDGKLTDEAVATLDSVVFSSEGLHKVEDIFSAVSRGSYGELQESKAHADWNARYTELTTYINNLQGYLGISPKKTTDSAGNEVDEELTVDNVEDATLKSALQAKQELKAIEPTPYTYSNAEANVEKVMPYGWVGSTYIASEGSDAELVNVKMGTGTYDDPITLGTPFVTKMQGTDGQYYDVRVTVTEILTGEDAMKDVQKYDEKNSGFTGASELVLATIKFSVENLTDQEIEVNSEFSLADKEQNLINRTGQLYSIPERAKIAPRGEAEMADWVYSKETLTTNLLWGKTFNRQFEALFINTLGNEVYDQYGRTMDRNTKEIVQNEAQADMEALKRIADEELKAYREANE